MARRFVLEQRLSAISSVAVAHFDSVGRLRVVPGAAHQVFAQQVEALAIDALSLSTPTDPEPEEFSASGLPWPLSARAWSTHILNADSFKSLATWDVVFPSTNTSPTAPALNSSV
nr:MULTISPECIES: hypothetical protein [unclassified Myxococcus]